MAEQKEECKCLAQGNGQEVADDHGGDVILVTPNSEREAARDHVLTIGVRILEQTGCQHGLLPSIECNISIFLSKHESDKWTCEYPLIVLGLSLSFFFLGRLVPSCKFVFSFPILVYLPIIHSRFLGHELVYTKSSFAKHLQWHVHQRCKFLVSFVNLSCSSPETGRDPH